MAARTATPPKSVTPAVHPSISEARMPSAGVPLTPVDPHTPFEDGFAATDDAIRNLAYRKWEEAGRPDGDGVEFWLQAERELNSDTPE